MGQVKLGVLWGWTHRGWTPAKIRPAVTDLWASRPTSRSCSPPEMAGSHPGAHEGGLVEPNGAGLGSAVCGPPRGGRCHRWSRRRWPVCQSQASSSATSLTVRPWPGPSPTWPHASSRGCSWLRCGGRAAPRGTLGAVCVHASHPVLLPPQTHGGAIDGQVDVGHDRTFLDLGQLRRARAAHRLADQVLECQCEVGPAAFVVQDHHVFEPDEGSEDLTRLAKNEGASWLLGHTSSLRHLSRPGTRLTV